MIDPVAHSHWHGGGTVPNFDGPSGPQCRNAMGGILPSGDMDFIAIHMLAIHRSGTVAQIEVERT